MSELILPGSGLDSVVTDEEVSGVPVTVVKAAEDSPWEDTIHVVADGENVWFIVTDFDSITDVIAELPISG